MSHKCLINFVAIAIHILACMHGTDLYNIIFGVYQYLILSWMHTVVDYQSKFALPPCIAKLLFYT